MRTFLTVFGLVVWFLLGAVFEAEVVFPGLKEKANQAGYLAGVQAQADNVCHALWSPQYRATLGEDGFIENCVMRVMD